MYFKERKNTQNTVKKAPYVGWWAVIYAKVIGADSFEEKLLCYSKIYGTIFRLPTAFYQRKVFSFMFSLSIARVIIYSTMYITAMYSVL